MAQLNAKTTSFTQSFSNVHTTLTSFGFDEVAGKDGTFYELRLKGADSQTVYPFRVYTHPAGEGRTTVNLEEAGFKSEEGVSPEAQAAAEKLLNDLSRSLSEQMENGQSTPIDEAMNGKMANNEAEVKELGKAMSNYPTNKEVKESGMVPDPIQ